ncbi:MAG TPA: hypothetical protein DGG95_05450, partial [Cytophagales bacterium]|nr:hypothetical protein [Cytophagales bacterium]
DDEIVVGLNQPIHHDDFEYVVTDFKVEKQIGTGEVALAAKGKFYIVNFKTINNAKRVQHEWNNSIAFLTDELGNTYENDLVAQQALEKMEPFGWQEKYVTEHQTEQSTRFVFQVPESIKQPYLKVRGFTLMGDFFDGNQFEKTKVKLFN